MTLEEAAKQFGFTAKSLRLLVRLKVIHIIPTEQDMSFLSLLSRIWKEKAWLRESLRQIRSKARREKLVRELELTKPERYVLNRYLNTEKRLSIQKVEGEVAHYYGMPKSVAMPMIRKIRSRAYTAKHRRVAWRLSNSDGKKNEVADRK